MGAGTETGAGGGGALRFVDLRFGGIAFLQTRSKWSGFDDLDENDEDE